MSAHANPDIVTNGLVFGFDTGYPLVSESHETYRYNRGEPTTTFDVGTMVPTNPNTYFTSNATYHSNLHGTVWDWSYYPNSNISADGGMEWVPNYEGPGFTGAWKMKKRAGGNSESNFSGAAPGAIDSSKTYTVSVWCKTDQASMARIHLNTTKSGSSYWGYASGYHSGGGGWERLSVTIPAGAGNTALNVIRCQCLGTNTNADSYWRDYQVEERSHATPFILGGTRSATGSLIDLTGNSTIDLSNVSFDSNAQMTFDGTDDYVSVPSFQRFASDSDLTIEAFVKPTSLYSYTQILGRGYSSAGYPNYYLRKGGGSVGWSFFVGDSSSNYTASDSDSIDVNVWQHVVGILNRSENLCKIYVNGLLKQTADATGMGSFENAGDNLVIGKSPNSVSYSYFAGDINTLKLYNKALTSTEVLQNYNATKSRFV